MILYLVYLLGGFRLQWENSKVLFCKNTLHFLVDFGSLILNMKHFQVEPLGNQSTAHAKILDIFTVKSRLSKEGNNDIF